MKKRFFALFLILALALTSLTACGSKDKDKSKNKAKSYKDIYEIIEEVANMKKGTATISIDADLGSAGFAKITFTVKNDGKNNGTISVGVDGDMNGTKLSTELEDAMIVKDNTAYFNVGGAMKAALSVPGAEMPEEVKKQIDDLKLGFFAFPLPDVDYSKFTSNFEDVTDIFISFLKNALKDAKVSGEDNEFTIAFKDAAAYKGVVSALADFVEKDALKLMNDKSNAEAIKTVDLNAYAKKVIDFYYDDVVELAKVFDVDKAMIDSLVDEVKKMDLNQYRDQAAEMVTADTISEADVKEMADEIRKANDEITDEAIKDFTTKATVKATDSGFKFSASVSGKNGKEEDCKITVSLKVSEDVDKIVAPSDVTRLRDFSAIATSIKAYIDKSQSNRDRDYRDFD